MKKLQIGKKGLTDEFLEQLSKAFDNTELIKITILKSACRDKKEAKEIEEKILNHLGKNFTSRLIGYVLTIRKWRKPKR